MSAQLETMGRKRKKKIERIARQSQARATASLTRLQAQTPRTEAEIISDIAALCVSPGFIHAIAFVCARDYMVGYGAELTGEHLLPLYSHDRLIRTEISTLIGFMARAEISFTHPGRAAVETYITRAEQLLEELHRSMVAEWGLGIADRTPEAVEATMSGGVFLREPFFYNGESAHSFQYRDYTPLKYVADSDWLEQERGLELGNVVAVVNAVLRYREHKHMLLARQKLQMQEWSALPAFTFDAGELAAASGLSVQQIRSVLDPFVFDMNSRNQRFRTLSDFNETNAYPIFRDADDRYVLLQYQAFAEALYETPFFWMNDDQDYKSTALKHRGDFAEALATARLKHVFGDGRVFRGVRIFEKKGLEVGEIDTLVVFGDRAIVLQAKSKRLTIAARQGNDLQIKADFKLAVQDACDQAHLCAEALRAGGYDLRDVDGRTIELKTPLREIFPVCVVSDHYPALAFQVGQFLTFKSDDVVAPPLATDLFALDVMTEMLESPLRLLSYLRLRARFRDRVVSTNEHAILGYHLRRNLWLGDDFNIYIGDDCAVDLDAALAVRRDGASGAGTPPGILTRFRGKPVGDLMHAIEASPDPAALELGLLLTELSEDTLGEVDNGLTMVVDWTARDHQPHDFSAGFSTARSGVTVYGVPALDPNTRMRVMAHMKMRKHICRANSWFGIVYTPDHELRAVIRLEHPWIADPELDAMTVEVRAKILATRGIPGRNDPCTCGSGLKFKKCCISLLS